MNRSGKGLGGRRLKHLSMATPTTLANEEVYERFINWLLEHPKYRQPKSIVEFAKENGLHRRTLYMWRQSPEAIKALRERREAYARDHMPEIVKALVETAKMKGRDGAADRKLVFQWLGYIGPEANVVTNNVTIHAAPAAQPDRVLASAMFAAISEGLDMTPGQKRQLQSRIFESLAPPKHQDLSDLLTVDYEVLDGRDERHPIGILEAAPVQEGPAPVDGGEPRGEEGDDPVEPAS